VCHDRSKVQARVVVVTVRRLAWAHGDLAVQSLGAMLGPVVFRLPDGRRASPLHVAPWVDEAGVDTLPGILRRLRGEWPCIPFGVERDLDLSGDWAGLSRPAPAASRPPHGLASNVDWTFADDDGVTVRLTLDLAPDCPVARLERQIAPDLHSTAVTITLTVHVRHDVTLPIGLHPVLRVPDSGVAIGVAGEDGGITFPGFVEPEVSRLAHGARFETLSAVPTADGGQLDLSRLPLAMATEELVQILGAGGRATVTYPGEGFTAELTWQAEHFPDLVLWVSNRGRTAFPWSGRHQALGVEPVCAAFDLGTAVSAGTNPLSRTGRTTARTFRAGEVFTTVYRLAVRA
jgi:hypothetical protein